jgi:hypothetical protein
MYQRLWDVALTCRMPPPAAANGGEWGCKSVQRCQASERGALASAGLRRKQGVRKAACAGWSERATAPWRTVLTQFLEHRNHSLTSRLHHCRRRVGDLKSIAEIATAFAGEVTPLVGSGRLIACLWSAPLKQPVDMWEMREPTSASRRLAVSRHCHLE